MDTQGFVAGPLSILCILGLVMGTASAAIITATDTGSGAAHHHRSPEAIISSLEQKGVDVSGVKTALQNGDITSVHTWLKSYFDANKGEVPLSHHSGHAQLVSQIGTNQ